jgi:hypothetical protein
VRGLHKLLQRHLNYLHSSQASKSAAPNEGWRVQVTFDFFLGGLAPVAGAAEPSDSDTTNTSEGGATRGRWVRFRSDPLEVPREALDENNRDGIDVENEAQVSFACSATAKVSIDGALVEWLHKDTLNLHFSLLPDSADRASSSTALGVAKVPLQHLLVSTGGLEKWVPVVAAIGSAAECTHDESDAQVHVSVYFQHRSSQPRSTPSLLPR